MKNIFFLAILFLLLGTAGCTQEVYINNNQVERNSSEDEEEHRERNDAAQQLPIDVEGSLQNPAWSPDGSAIVLTNWKRGYNRGPADILIYDLEENTFHTLVSNGSDNVNLPGSAWNESQNLIVFSSTREPHDEIFVIPADGSPGDEIRITSRDEYVAYEPSLSPDGEWVVFESHVLDVEENGVIIKYRLDGTSPYIPLTSLDDDCRQPNWSSSGEHILYQKYEHGQWEVYTMDADGKNPRKITNMPGSKTDASFSPDGLWVVFSLENEDIEYANLYAVSLDGEELVRITESDTYDGAPSWSPDGKRIVFESSPGDPEDTGTTIWVIEVSGLF